MSIDRENKPSKFCKNCARDPSLGVIILVKFVIFKILGVLNPHRQTNHGELWQVGAWSVQRVASHSLTHCCAWPAEGRSVLHIERSWLAIWTAPTDRPMSSSTCCSQVLRGRPGGRFQSAAGGVPVWASIDSCSTCEAGVFSGRRQMWPNNEWRLSAIRDGRAKN